MPAALSTQIKPSGCQGSAVWFVKEMAFKGACLHVSSGVMLLAMFHTLAALGRVRATGAQAVRAVEPTHAGPKYTICNYNMMKLTQKVHV
jgi:hypothetical protein